MKTLTKYSTLIFLAFISLSFFYDPANIEYWSTDNLKGKVKMYRENYYEAWDYFGKTEKKLISTSSDKKYNEQGKILEKEGNKYWKYDDNGNLIEFIYQDSKSIAKYDDSGSMIELTRFRNNSFRSKSEIIYDNNLKVIEINRYNADVKLEEKVINKYDSRGNKIEERFYKEDGSLNYVLFSKYNVNNDITETIKYSGNNRFLSKISYKYLHDYNIEERMGYDSIINLIKKYDKNGNLIEKTFDPYSEHSMEKLIRKYDQNGNIIEEKKIYDNRFNHHYTYKYDNLGNMIEHCILFENGIIENKFNYVYKYDKFGNWVQKIVFKNNITPINIYEREYEYYN